MSCRSHAEIYAHMFFLHSILNPHRKTTNDNNKDHSMFSHPDISELSPSLSCTESYCGDTEGGRQITEKTSKHREVLQYMLLMSSALQIRVQSLNVQECFLYWHLWLLRCS